MEENNLTTVATAIWTGLGMVIGGSIGFFAAWLRSRHEIDQLRAQTSTLAGELLEKVQKARCDYRDECLKVGDLASEFRDILVRKVSDEELPTKYQELNAKRDQLCRAFLDYAIPAYLSHIEFQLLERHREKGDPHEIEKICGDTCDELKRFKGWLDIINVPELLEKLKRSPAKIQERTFRPMDQIIRHLPVAIRNEESLRLRAAVKNLVSPS